MDQIIMFFNENVGFVGGILSLVITFATVVYAFFTWRLADETKRLRMVHSEPLISITVTPYDFVMLYVKIIIENIGEGPAYNISFSFRDNIDLGEQKHLSDLNFLKQCKYLKPKQKIESYFSSYQQLKDVTFYITVHYENSIGTKYQEEFEFNLSDLEGITRLGGVPIYNIAESMKKIEQNLNHLTTGFKKMNVNVYTQEDRD